MNAFRRIVFAALFAGLLAGGFATVAHQLGTVPLILAAEELEAETGSPLAEDSHVHADRAAHEHGPAWAPGDGLERTAYTLLADLLTGVSYGLVLVAALALRDGATNWRRGLFWGLAGFATFVLAPGLGLPPELPGSQLAPVLDRQLWWSATATATAGGLALVFLTRRAVWAALGTVLIVLPHAIGAPPPPSDMGLAPEDLAQRFAVVSTLVNFLFWAVLGSAAGHLYGRAAARA